MSNLRYLLVHIDSTGGKPFTYSTDNDNMKPGMWVNVKVNGQIKRGLVIEEEKGKNYGFTVQPVISIIHETPLPAEYIELLKWTADYYMADFQEIINAAIPKNLKPKKKSSYIYIKDIFCADSMEEELLDYMRAKKEVSSFTLVKKFGKEIVARFVKKGVIKLSVTDSIIKARKKEADLPAAPAAKQIKLTTEQAAAKESIVNGKKGKYLLHGITGSGKTEVYIAIINEAVKKNEGAIFLVPEISLTPQVIERFSAEFGAKMAILHSRLTDSERAEQWRQVLEKEKKIVLGVRSAIFAPVADLKYIIIDEEHETTYKQDTSPRYHARYVAMRRAEIEGAKVIMGSATPSIESYYFAEQGYFELISLKNRFNEHGLPNVEVVNMKQEQDIHFSGILLEKMAKRLRAREQVILFLNRKGYSNFVQCKACGHIERCDRCSVSYIYYKSENKLKCSYCGREKIFKPVCSKCGSQELTYHGHGTEKIEKEVEHYFEKSSVLRVDSDTVKERGSYEKIYRDFLARKYDILLGTQIISKGFHFPGVTLAGIVSADTILNFPDFRSGEKTFQMIVQASGRAGRESHGEVIVQTYTPDHYVIERAVKADYKGFYNDEIEIRKALMYPPFGRIINIIISAEEEDGLEENADILRKGIEYDGVDIFGPFKAPIYKIKNRYRYQIFIKGPREKINEMKFIIKSEVMKNKREDIRITVDVDPINLM